MPLQKILDPSPGQPFKGGAITSSEKAALPFGAFSMVYNMRKDPKGGFFKRPGMSKLHTTADSTNSLVSFYQFKKERVTGNYYLAQMSDSDVLVATTSPPGATAGAFGSELYSGSSGQKPAAWGRIADLLIYSNGVDRHQIYPGTGNYVEAFVKFDGAAAPGNVPAIGYDYSTEVRNTNTSQVAVLDSLNTYAAFECVFIRTPVKANSFYVKINAANANASVLDVYYWNGAWTDANVTDGTASGGATLAVDGTISWTAPSDEITKYQYGACGYWYQIRVGTQLDAEVEITYVTYGGAFQNVENVWNSVPQDAIEAYFRDDSATPDVYELYDSGAVEVGEMTSSDKVYFATTDPIEAFYVDVGGVPNTGAGTAIDAVYGWTGAAFASLGTVSDGTNGMTNSGWVTFPRVSTVQPTQFQESQFYAYWYYFEVDGTLAADMLIGIQVAPFFDMLDFGRSGTSVIWKDRGVYSFDDYPEYLYLSAKGNPQILNGTDFGILETGDGRANKVVAVRKLYNELMVWQDDSGPEGGTLTLFEGYSPTTFGKLLINSRYGTFSNNSVEVVEGILVKLGDREQIKTMAFFICRAGIAASDGQNVWIISEDIENYFDPTQDECIRRGYETSHWLRYDSTYNIVRVGLVTGSSATTPNVFPVFHLGDKTWSFDGSTPSLSIIGEVEAASGNDPIIQVGGGQGDGFIYLLNTGSNDVDAAIDAYAEIELSRGGDILILREVMLDVLAQTGNVTFSTKINGVTSISGLNVSMAAAVTNETTRRHRWSLNQTGKHLSLKFRNATASQGMKLLSLGLNVGSWKGR